MDRTNEMKEKGNTLMIMLVLFSLMLGMLIGCVGNDEALPANNIAITSTPSHTAWVDINYQYTVTANQTFVMYTAALPGWLQVSGGNTLWGLPPMDGAWPVSLRITSTTTGTVAWQNWTIYISVVNWIPTVTSADITYGMVGHQYVYPMTFNSSAFVGFHSLPSWLHYYPQTTTLSGIPTIAGSYPISLDIYNINDVLALQSAYHNFTITVVAAGSAVFTSTPATTGTMGVLYTYTPTISPAVPANYTISATEAPVWSMNHIWTPALPEMFNGTPDHIGVYQFRITVYQYVTVGVVPFQSIVLVTYGWQNWTVTVGIEPFPVFLGADPTTTIVAGSYFTYTPRTDISSTITIIQSPDWMSYSGGKLSGTPSVVGLYQVKVMAYSTTYGTYTIQTFNVKVDPMVWAEMQIENMWFALIPVFILIVIGLMSALSPEGFSITVMMSALAIGIGLLTWTSVLPQWTLIITGIIIVLLIFRAQDSEVISIGRN